MKKYHFCNYLAVKIPVVSALVIFFGTIIFLAVYSIYLRFKNRGKSSGKPSSIKRSSSNFSFASIGTNVSKGNYGLNYLIKLFNCNLIFIEADADDDQEAIVNDDESPA